MRVSNLKVLLNEKDLLGIINENIQVDGLTIETIHIKDLIEIKGFYKKGVTVPFKIKVGVGRVHGNILNLKIFNINILKFSILKGVKNLALKKFLKEFYKFGITIDKDNVYVDINLISKFIPYVYFKLNNVVLVEGGLELQGENIIYAKDKKVKVTMEDKEEFNVNKFKDKYNRRRKKIITNTPCKYRKIAEYAMIIPDIVILLSRLFKDKRVKFKTKLLIGGIIAYIISPIEILPDFVPFIGKIDDIAIAFYGLNEIFNQVSEEIIFENWPGKDNIILKVKEVILYIGSIVGSNNVSKIVNFIKSLCKNKKSFYY